MSLLILSHVNVQDAVARAAARSLSLQVNKREWEAGAIVSLQAALAEAAKQRQAEPAQQSCKQCHSGNLLATVGCT